MLSSRRIHPRPRARPTYAETAAQRRLIAGPGARSWPIQSPVTSAASPRSGLSIPMHSRLRWLETLQGCLGSGARREDFGFSRGWGGGHRRAGGAGGDVLRLRA